MATWSAIEPRGYHRTAEIEGAAAIGAEECLVCHEDVLGRAPAPAYHANCEACHGAGDLHADSEDAGRIRFPASADCLSCHETGRATHLEWATAAHARAGLICTDCHDTHNREPYHVRRVANLAFRHTGEGSTLCISCHPDVASRLSLPSHHPLREGMLDCTDCHPPHGDRRTALGARTQLCASCHQDHVGPWIFEHPPVAEDCLYCHTPHGAASEDLLETSQPALCISCHSLPDSVHFSTGEMPAPTTVTGTVAFAFYTRCTDCHGAIHGSYQDPHLRR